MKSTTFTALLVAFTLSPLATVAQLSGSVGPTTSTASKRSKKTCNVLDYGAKADKTTDLGPALSKAWQACVGGGLGKFNYPSSLYHSLHGITRILIYLQWSYQLVIMPWQHGLA
jgi:hypothetical protein